MPFCPKCRYEYREEIERCPDCGEKLVPVLAEDPPQYSTEHMDLVEIYSGETPTVYVLEEALKDRGIASILRPKEPLAGLLAERAMPPFSVLLVSSHDLAEHREKIDEALSLITEFPEVIEE